ncbi:hypothetical protein ACLB1N_36380 [Escherichia coli]
MLRYPGYALGTDSELPEPVILWVAKQVQAEPAAPGEVRRARRRPVASMPRNCAPTCNWPRSACPTSAPWCAS